MSLFSLCISPFYEALVATVLKYATSIKFACLLATSSLISDQFSHLHQEDGLSPREQELKDLKESLQDTQPVGVLVDCCKTMDQVRTSL